jgi:hypothetical protein
MGWLFPPYAYTKDFQNKNKKILKIIPINFSTIPKSFLQTTGRKKNSFLLANYQQIKTY